MTVVHDVEPSGTDSQVLTADVTVLEPVIVYNFTTVSIVTGDAGDTINYVLEVKHDEAQASVSGAHAVSFEFEFDVDKFLNTSSFVSTGVCIYA